MYNIFVLLGGMQAKQRIKYTLVLEGKVDERKRNGFWLRIECLLCSSPHGSGIDGA